MARTVSGDFKTAMIDPVEVLCVRELFDQFAIRFDRLRIIVSKEMAFRRHVMRILLHRKASASFGRLVVEIGGVLKRS